MAKENTLGITIKKEEDMPEWYGQVCQKAELADYAPVKGCMIIRPRGYAIWQSIQDEFNKVLNELNVDNAYFPLFIPESFFHKEASHVEGFAPEVAWIHTDDKEAIERLALRPTSETIMYDSYSNWVQSYRDLPLRINQWCNIVRWETKQTKLFLRSREFLWQEGHCVYETEKEAHEEMLLMLRKYEELLRDHLAIPTMLGYKTEMERFPGAINTSCIEGFMPDGKALQCGTSHNLGQGFAKAFDISFLGRDEKPNLPWQTSWGFSTRLIGAIVMTHSDDKGLVLPPKVAKDKCVIVPIIIGDSKDKVLNACKKLHDDIKKDFRTILDDREEHNTGFKFNEWELKGVPLRIELGPKDLEKESCMIVRRDNKEKVSVKLKDIKKEIPKILEKMQKDMYQRAKKTFDDSIVEVDNLNDFLKAVKARKLIKAPFCCEKVAEEKLLEDTQGVTARCIPLEGDEVPKGTKCFFTGKPAKSYVYFAKAY